jgi:hypothetical protein
LASLKGGEKLEKIVCEPTKGKGIEPPEAPVEVTPVGEKPAKKPKAKKARKPKAEEPTQPIEPKSMVLPVKGFVNAYGFIHLNGNLLEAFGGEKGKKTPITIDLKEGALIIRKA